MRQLITWMLLGLTLMACQPAAVTMTVSPEAAVAQSTSVPATEVDMGTTNPTITPMDTTESPAIELLSGFADTCTVAESYSTVLGFEVIYSQMNTEHIVAYRLLDNEGNLIIADDTPGENREGEGNWGFYPVAYDLPDNAALTVEVTVFESDDENANPSSVSSLIYNCSTGETITTSFVAQ